MRSLKLISLLLLVLIMSSCGRNMYDQPKYKAYSASNMFANGSSAQPLIANTVPRTIAGNENYVNNPEYYTGLGATGFVSEIPFDVTEAFLQRGQERFNIYCSACHNYTGEGNGMVVQKGFVQPSSFHVDRLRTQPAGYFVNAMTNGFGRMYSYASRVPPEDRWAIAAYIKTLQYSQYALATDTELICAVDDGAGSSNAQDHTPASTEGESH